MAENTRMHTLIRESEERQNARLEERLLHMTTSIQNTLEAAIERKFEAMQMHNAGNNGSSSRNAGQSRNSNYSCATRMARLDFPRFNGDSVKNWLIQCETFFAVDQTPEEFKVRMAVMHLEGKALQWHSTLVKTVGAHNLPRWEEYAQMLVYRFGDVCDDPISELMKLRQQGSVVEYHERFDEIVSRLEISPEYMLSCFLGGLKEDVQMMIRMFQPDSVRRAFQLAKMYEASRKTHVPYNAASKSQKPGNYPSQSVVSTASHSSPIIPHVPVTVLEKPQPYKRLSPAYMTERRAKGLCFFYDEKFTPEHAAKHRKMQIHVMEMDDDEGQAVLEEEEKPEAEESQSDLMISVNALTGVPTFNTMRITGHYMKKPLHILIDSGST